MIAGIVLGCLALLCGLTLYQRVSVEAVWGPADRSFQVRYLGFSFRRLRRRRKEEKEKPKRRRRSALGWVRLAPDLLRAIGKGLKFLLRHSELRHLKLEGNIGTEDPAATGILWGTIEAIHGTLKLWSPQLEWAIAPDFDAGQTSLTLDAEGAVRMGALVATAPIILWHLPKRKIWRLLREQRRQRKASLRARQKEVKAA